ncbi:MAG: hypothetical protein WCT53_00850 [Candidatus Gracilibacteria bacterium]
MSDSTSQQPGQEPMSFEAFEKELGEEFGLVDQDSQSALTPSVLVSENCALPDDASALGMACDFHEQFAEQLEISREKSPAPAATIIDSTTEMPRGKHVFPLMNLPSRKDGGSFNQFTDGGFDRTAQLPPAPKRSSATSAQIALQQRQMDETGRFTRDQLEKLLK